MQVHRRMTTENCSGIWKNGLENPEKSGNFIERLGSELCEDEKISQHVR